jgi:23S rRNA (guanosine2251-2'-O)-methyltransferase
MIYIILDNIRSAWNVGAIMRTCDAIGAEIILVGYTPQPTGRTKVLLSKTAIGAENTVNWKHYNHGIEVFETMPKEKYLHLGIEISDTSKLLYDYLADKNNEISLKKDICLWFGNEIHGLSSDVVNMLDSELHLPMKGSKESINVASCVCSIGYLFDMYQYNRVQSNV